MANSSEESRGTRVKACTECRQQKLRCDASKDYSRPCSRCKRFSLDCIISKDFQRVKRRTKAELQAELELLRKEAGVGTSGHTQSRPNENVAAGRNDDLFLPRATSMSSTAFSFAPALGQRPLNNDFTSSELGFTTSAAKACRDTIASQFPVPSPRSMADMPGSSVPPIGDAVQLDEATVPPTSAQTVHDLTVDAQDIDDCFEIFFEKNLRYLPIFDGKLTPNSCHAVSPFLFWTIVVIGSRRYPKDPTLILQLAPKVLDLAKCAIFAPERVLSTIQALVILCTWQLPIDTLQKDITPQLAGAMIQLATHVGLHVYGSVQDFTRVPLKYDSQQRSFRTKLWSICLYTCQRVNNSRGLPPVVLMDTYGHDGYRENPLATLSCTVRFQRKLCQVQNDAILQIERTALSRKEAERNILLGSTVNACVAELASLNAECPSMLDQLILVGTQLQVSACHLIVPSSFIGESDIISMYSDACTLLELATALDQEQELCEFGSTNVNVAWNLAAFVILRVGRSHVRDSLDLKRGQRCYFSAINLNKKQSVRSDDLSARATMILSQLWTSKMVIKRPDGTPDSLWLRCRNRLGWSLAFDCFWLWRQEFGGQPNAYDSVDDDVKMNDTKKSIRQTSPGLNSMSVLGVGWTPDSLLQDFQWPIFDESLFDSWTGSDADPSALS